MPSTITYTDKQNETGPFDIIGDIHGCYDELCELLDQMGYQVDKDTCTAAPPAGRKAVFLGDLCDRGPKNPEVLRLVINMTEHQQALCVLGNHDVKLSKTLAGRNTKLTYGLETTMAQLDQENEEFRGKAARFLDSLISHYVLDNGRLVVAHAGLKEKYQGCSSGKARHFSLYGDTTGETDEFGLPVRLNWARKYHGKALVVYGHTPSLEARFENNTICIDTGCVFGGKLTAYRYPEGTLVQVPAKQVYYEPVKPLDADLMEQDQQRGKSL